MAITRSNKSYMVEIYELVLASTVGKKSKGASGDVDCQLSAHWFGGRP